MNIGKKVYTAIAAAVLILLGSVIQLVIHGFGEGWSFLAILCQVTAALGVIVLGLDINRITNSIMSMVGKLRDGNCCLKKETVGPTAELASAITGKFKQDSELIAELKQEIKSLEIQVQLSKKQKRNTEEIIYSIHDAVVVTDEFDKILMANEAAGDIFGFDPRQVQYRTIDEVMPADQQSFVEFIRQTRQGRVRHARRELDISCADQDVRNYNCTISSVYDEREKVCGVVAVLHDITKEKEISQMKNDFVSHVSHELKTPLASITAYSEMLVDGEADDEQTRKEFYSVIQSQANRLNRLIEDILNVSRIESGLIKIEKEPVSLTILIQDQMNMIKGFAEEKNIEVIGQIPIIHGRVNADKDMLSQVIVNLLSNAVKYTPSGGTVKVTSEVDDIENLVRVRISDTGVGIGQDALPYVFDKFYRVKENNKQAKGTGLGLNLVKQIIEKVHSGRVFVESEKGVGSTFGFELPLAGTEENCDRNKSKLVEAK